MRTIREIYLQYNVLIERLVLFKNKAPDIITNIGIHHRHTNPKKFLTTHSDEKKDSSIYSAQTCGKTTAKAEAMRKISKAHILSSFITIIFICSHFAFWLNISSAIQQFQEVIQDLLK